MKIIATILVGILTLSSLHSKEGRTADNNSTGTRPQVEVTFVLDTTGSMGGLIEGAKQKIWSIANKIVDTEDAPEVKFGLIGYRDIGDEYVTKIYDLSTDLDIVYARLMEFRAQGGGDTPESVNRALYESVTQITWSENQETLRLIFLVGDAPPHMDYEYDIDYTETCQMAVEKDIMINTIQCGSIVNTQEIWQAIAQSAHGKYVAIEQSGGMHAIKTPQDEAIARLNREMASTVITYGDAQAQRIGQSKVNNAKAAAPEVAAERYNYFASSVAGSDAAPVAISGDEDLVAQLAENKIEFDEIDQDSLPDALKPMNESELGAHVAAQLSKRKEIQAELNRRLKARQAYIDSENKRLEAEGQTDGFDFKVNQLIREQAALKGIR